MSLRPNQTNGLESPRSAHCLIEKRMKKPQIWYFQLSNSPLPFFIILIVQFLTFLTEEYFWNQPHTYYSIKKHLYRSSITISIISFTVSFSECFVVRGLRGHLHRPLQLRHGHLWRPHPLQVGLGSGICRFSLVLISGKSNFIYVM
jgi:hypothetical protein